jgi:hypothetical protein
MKSFAPPLVALSAWLLLWPAETARAQQPLERALLDQAPELMTRFRERGYKNVGVLKFQVERERSGKTTPINSEFNQLLATRMETALILSDSFKNPVGILKNATATAQKIEGAGVRNPKERLRMFDSLYGLAWGPEKQKVRADAFVTGHVVVSKDLETLRLQLKVFDTLTEKTDFTSKEVVVANRADLLAEMGASFPFRSVFRRKDDSSGSDKYVAENKEYKPEPFKAALHAEYERKVHPAEFSDEPVKLVVKYNGNSVPFVMKKDGDGFKAFIAEPRQGDVVTMILLRDGSRNRYAVVLKVNGENTINRETQTDFYCHKWVLEPDFGPALVDGYLMDKSHEPFRVLSQEESKLVQNSFGERAGTISMTVFRERVSDEPPPISPVAVDLNSASKERIVAKAPQIKDAPADLKELKRELFKDEDRGLIVPSGARTSDDRPRVPFIAAETPIMNLTLYYYKNQ